MTKRKSLGLSKRITVLVLGLASVVAVACGTLEVGIERAATPDEVATVADVAAENAHLSAQATSLAATRTPPPIPSADVEAVVDRLNKAPGARTVVVFPADYAATLAAHTQHRVVPLSINADSARTTVEAALAIVLPASGLVDVVIVDQEATSSVPQLRMALEQRLYRRDDTEAFGTLEHHPFVVGPEEPTLDPIGAVFEGGVELVAGGALDGLEPGALLRLAFDWRVAEPVDDPLVMFAHLAHQGRLVAQRDAVPGNGLFPVASWEPGELVRDQFALQLPSELPPGLYEVQVGIYSSTGGRRHSLVDPKGGTCLVVQELAITDSGQPAVSSAPTPAGARLVGPTRTSTFVPTPTASAPTAAPLPTDTLAARMNATPTQITGTSSPTPEFTDWDVHTWSSSSPHGVWTAETTAAFPIVDSAYVGEEYYYTQLKVTRRDQTVEWTAVDEWSRWALGYTTPQPLHWSKDRRYLYFTNRPVPDGCALFVNGSDLRRLDLRDGSVTEIVPSVGLALSLSPDEATLAYVGYGDRGLILRDLATGKEQSVNMDDSVQGSTGSMVWSPDGTALMLTAAFPKCAPEDERMHSIVRIDVATLSATTLLAQDTRRLTTTEWPEAGRAVLTDGNGDRWGMDPVTGQMAREE